MRAGVMLLEEWTPSDLVNNMWLFNYVGFKITQEDLGVVTSFLDYEIEDGAGPGEGEPSTVLVLRSASTPNSPHWGR